VNADPADVIAANFALAGVQPGPDLPGWSKKMSRPTDVIALIHPCIDGSSGMSSQLLTHIGTNTMSRGPSRDVR
jgi:hypothetical protein